MQEDIREGMATRLDYNCEGCTLPETFACVHPCEQQYMVADELIKYLNSHDVVIAKAGFYGDLMVPLIHA